MAETATRVDCNQETDDPVGVLRRFSKAFETFDTEAFLSTWDGEAESIVYQPEELRHAIFTLDGLRSYFENLPRVIRGLRDVKVLDFNIEVNGGIAVAYTRFWCRISLAPVPQTVDGQIRQTFIMRRRAEGWKLFHYHESRQAVGFEEAVGQW